jgi:RNA polymerase sigma-70 factor (ECF subfamily)
MPEPAPLNSTLVLIDRARTGDDSARDALLRRFLPALRVWAHGRLPADARGLADTDDLVQVALLGALRNLEGFEYRHDGAFLAYLRRALLNGVRAEVRRGRQRRTDRDVDEERPDLNASVVEQVAGRETMERYERALLELPEEARIAVILRIEFEYPYARIAELTGRETSDAARMYVTRAIRDLARILARV